MVEKLGFLTWLTIWAKTLLATLLAQNSPVPCYESSDTLMLKNKMLAVIVIVVATALGGGIMTFAIGLPSSLCAGVPSPTYTFMIIEDVNGYNNSALHQGSWPAKPWPVLSVRQCGMVVIRIVNKDTQTHGFAVDFYAFRGTEIQGGQSLTVQFLATKTGQFRVYCNTICSVHWSMLYGTLNVS